MKTPWINHDVHRSVRVVPSDDIVELLIKMYVVIPYPTMQRLHELFYFEDGKLVWVKPVRRKPSRGWINKKDGKHYMRVDGKQCQIERLVAIYTGEE
jgi:hypothetical protein